MKKILALTAVLAASVMLFTGCGTLMPSCGGETVSSELLRDKPWSNPYNYEKTTYDLDRYAATVNEDGSFTANTDKLLASGTYVTEIEVADRSIADWSGLGALSEEVPGFSERILGRVNELTSSPSAYTVLRTTFELTYTDDADNSDRKGATDRMESVVMIRNINMQPVFSYKHAELASSGIGYSAFADYLAGENVYSESKDGTATVTDRVTEIGTSYDNEELFLLERAQSGIKEGVSATYSVHSAVETGVYGEEAVHTIAAAVTTDVADDPSDNYAYDKYGKDETSFINDYVGDAVAYYDAAEAEKKETEEGYSFPVNRAVFYRNETNMGTSTTVYYSDVDFNYFGMTTSNVMMYFATYETNTEGEAVNMTVGEISDYTIVR